MLAVLLARLWLRSKSVGVLMRRSYTMQGKTVYHVRSPTYDVYMRLSTWSVMAMIWFFSCDASLPMMEAAMTGLDTPHALPRAFLEGTNT